MKRGLFGLHRNDDDDDDDNWSVVDNEYFFAAQKHHMTNFGNQQGALLSEDVSPNSLLCKQAVLSRARRNLAATLALLQVRPEYVKRCKKRQKQLTIQLHPKHHVTSPVKPMTPTMLRHQLKAMERVFERLENPVM